MCGIVMLWDRQKIISATDRRDVAETILEELNHRGPDGSGVYSDDSSGLTIGHRRLSIVDLSSQGAQPMRSHDGRWILSFNGELYNHQTLRREAERAGLPLKGRSDTNVLLEKIAAEGFERAISSVHGAYAVIAWDSIDKTLYLARDAFGEKPLSFGTVDGLIVALSELRAIESVSKRYPRLASLAERSPESLEAYFHFGYVPEPRSIYAAFKKVRPGTFLRWRETPGALPEEMRIVPSIESGENGSSGALKDLLVDVLAEEIGADVPVAILLSGGIDSTIVAAAAREAAVRGGHPSPLAITVGFEEASFDESVGATGVAKHLALRHEVIRVNSSQALGVASRLGATYDEPFSDSSQIATMLVYEAASRHAKVCLGGDGGDELFAGYYRHKWVEQVERLRAALPGWGRASISAGLTSRLGQTMFRLATLNRFTLSNNKAEKLSRFLMAEDTSHLFFELYRQAESERTSKTVVASVLGSSVFQSFGTLNADNIRERVIECDQKLYLTSDLLVKNDRASMSVSVEARSPLLHPRVANWSSIHRETFSVGVAKAALKSVLRSWVPDALWDRPKSGFAVPIDEWLRGGLCDWSHSVLFDAGSAEGGSSQAYLRRAWSEHQAGVNRSMTLWPEICYRLWVQARASVHKFRQSAS